MASWRMVAWAGVYERARVCRSDVIWSAAWMSVGESVEGDEG